MATNYDEIEVEAWNTRHFKQYIEAEHERIFGVPYCAFQPHIAESQLIAKFIGTGPRAKRPIERKISNELFKAFIDRCFASYTPTAKFPGMSLKFAERYMGNVLQQLLAEEKAKQDELKAVATQTENEEATLEWL